MLQTLDVEAKKRLRLLQEEVGNGDALTATRWQELQADERFFEQKLGILPNNPNSAYEPFRLIRDTRTDEAIIGARWWFHTLGLRHGSVHVILLSPQGWFVCQRRSRHKDDAPGAIDHAVTGHSGTLEPVEAAWKELSEEVGIVPDADNPMIESNRLRPVGVLEYTGKSTEDDPMPVINCERTWIFEATLTNHGMASMHFADGEVSALLFLGNTELNEIHNRIQTDVFSTRGELDLAWGIRRSLPLWMAQRK